MTPTRSGIKKRSVISSLLRIALSLALLALLAWWLDAGAVIGDVSRAWRHGREDPEHGIGPAARAVILERASGQLVMGVVAAVSLVSLPLAFTAAPATVALAVCGVGVGVLGTFLVFRRRPRTGLLATLGRDTYTALLARDALPVQLLSSTLVVGTYLATYVVAARAVGVSTPLWTLLPLVAPVLLSMLVPATVAGWGVREATAAALLGRRRTHSGGRSGDLGRLRDSGAALQPSGSPGPAGLSRVCFRSGCDDST